MQTNFDDLAIKAALEGKWQEAVTLNLQILEEQPTNIPALNRLAKAHAQLGDTEKAIATYESVLKLDRFNTIAKRQCESLRHNPTPCASDVSPILAEFIEEPGKTKTTALVRLGDQKIIASLQPGQVMSMLVKSHWIEIKNHKNEYVGSLADNISFKIKQMIAGGNQYQTIIRTVSPNQVSVFIKELKRAAAFANTPSF